MGSYRTDGPDCYPVAAAEWASSAAAKALPSQFLTWMRGRTKHYERGPTACGTVEQAEEKPALRTSRIVSGEKLPKG